MFWFVLFVYSVVIFCFYCRTKAFVHEYFDAHFRVRFDFEMILLCIHAAKRNKIKHDYKTNAIAISIHPTPLSNDIAHC